MKRDCLKIAASAALLWAVFVAKAPAQYAALAATNQTNQTIQLGDSVAPLYGPWKFTVGDSPVDASGQPLWAEPGFDDSKWETQDLTPKDGSIDPVSGLSGYVAGWTSRGHPGYWGYGWYRIRVKVESKPGAKLALAGPANVDDAYQVFDNGSLIGAFGTFRSYRPTVYFTQPKMFQLENAASGGEQTRVLAFRFWMEPNTLIGTTDVGGIHSAPQLGEAGAVAARNQVQWDELIRSYSLSLILGVMFGMLGLVALSLRLFDETDSVYLWIAALLLTLGLRGVLTAIGSWTEWIPALTLTVVDEVVLIPLVFIGWIMVWRVWFRLKRAAWVPRVLPALVILLIVSFAVGDNVFFTVVSQPVAHVFGMLNFAARVLTASLVLGTVIQGIVQQGLDGWLALPAVLFACVSKFRAELAEMHVNLNFMVFGIGITTSQIADLLLVGSLSILLLRRLLISVKSQRQMALDVKQAQEVQQVILPMRRQQVSGFAIDTEYRPAREVGGDFFQIIPDSADGSLLIVAGDVAGKGLRAGMLVALLVGAIRTAVAFNREPARLLRELNQRLLGRGDAQATCLALRIDPDGSATLANAGHMPPYLNGRQMPMEGALPLGMVEEAEFSVMRFKLSASDRLVLLSDGIVEATDLEGKLFGFERVLELMRTSISAAEVADAAQKFGQEDDISVISLTRNELLSPVMA
jgi:hypothetical protein